VEASPFYRGGKVVRGGNDWRVMEYEMSIIKAGRYMAWLRRGGRVKEGH
jgi:hypothetical protein